MSRQRLDYARQSGSEEEVKESKVQRHSNGDECHHNGIQNRLRLSRPRHMTKFALGVFEILDELIHGEFALTTGIS